jgi:hypothetical protein
MPLLPKDIPWHFQGYLLLCPLPAGGLSPHGEVACRVLNQALISVTRQRKTLFPKTTGRGNCPALFMRAKVAGEIWRIFFAKKLASISNSLSTAAGGSVGRQNKSLAKASKSLEVRAVLQTV